MTLTLPTADATKITIPSPAAITTAA
jgi:hypothetical protein